MELKITNEDVKKYEYLVHKIARQELPKSQMSLEDLEGYGYEGLIAGFRNYNPDRGQTLKQYIAYQIYYSIRNNVYKEGTVIKMSSGTIKQRKEAGQTLYITTPLAYQKGDETVYIKEPAEEMRYDEGVWGMIQTEILKKYKTRDLEIFAKSFGLFGLKTIKQTDIAKEYGITPAAVTLNNQKLIKLIKTKPEIMDLLEDLL